MTDRIEELRALVGNGLRLTIVEVDALLDCAEALRRLMYFEDRTVTNEMRAQMVRASREALSRLNGEGDD